MPNNYDAIQLAAAMQQPLQRCVEKLSVPRQVFNVDSLQQGQLAVYDTTPGTTIAQINDSGSPRMFHSTTRVYVPEFELASNNLRIPLQRFKDMELEDLGILVTQHIEQDIIRRENELFFEMLKTAENLIQNDGFVANDQTEFDAKVMMTANKIEQFDLEPHFLICHPAKQHFFLTPAQRIRSIEIVCCDLCEKDHFYILPAREHFGVLSERIPLTCVPSDNPEHREIGFVFFETIGMAIFQPKYCIKCKFICREFTGAIKFKNKYDYFNKTWWKHELESNLE